jgi:Putative adhesin
MPTFDTPEPISVTVELGVGDIRIVASDRTDTIVEVRPSDAAKQSDVTAAEQTRVEYAGGRLLVKAPKGWKQYTFRGGGESIDVQVDLPAGSQVRGDAGVAALRCSGRLGECRYRTGVGDIHLDQAGPVQLKTGAGDITVDQAVGGAELTTGSGAVRIDSIDGTAVVKNSNGDTWIGEVTGDLRVNAANGKISVDQAHATVAAKAANGDVRLGEVTRGAILAQTGFGKVEIGVLDGVAAWLDLSTRFGNVQNDLDAAERPEPDEDAVEVRARTAFGDITIHRAFADDTGKDNT